MSAVAEFIDLSFRPDLGLLFGRWLRAATDEEVHQGYEAVLAVAAPHGARYWLLDLRRRGPGSQAATRWVLDAFLPRLAAGLQRRYYLAYLLSPAHLAQVREAPPTASPGPYAVEVFTDECAALQWLRRCQQEEQATRQ